MTLESVNLPAPAGQLSLRNGLEPVRMVRAPVESLSPHTWDELWTLTTRFVTTDRAAWEGKLLEHDEVVLYRGRTSGALVGMAAVDVAQLTHEGRRVNLIFTSSVLIDERYRGQNLIQRAGMASFLRVWRRQPLTPIYWVFDTFSYKSYLLLARNFVDFWPAQGRGLPTWEAGLLQRFASQRYGEDWEPERGVVRSRGHKRLKEGVAAIDEANLRHADIRFFAERNPHHARGDLLLCLAPLSLRNWQSILARSLRRALRRVA